MGSFAHLQYVVAAVRPGQTKYQQMFEGTSKGEFQKKRRWSSHLQKVLTTSDQCWSLMDVLLKIFSKLHHQPQWLRLPAAPHLFFMALQQFSEARHVNLQVPGQHVITVEVSIHWGTPISS